MDLSFFVAMILVGVGVGLISNIVGLGGGILMVPAFLTFVPGMDPHTAKGTSLFIIIFVAATNAWRLHRGVSDPPWRTAGWLALGSIAGGYGAAWLTTWLPDKVILAGFLALVVLLAIQMFLLNAPTGREGGSGKYTLKTSIVGLLSGAVGGATGTGGGAVLVPLALKTGLSTNARVVGLSNLVMIPTSMAASIAHLMAAPLFHGPGTVGHVNFPLVPLVFVGAQLGSPIGRWVNARLALRQRRMLLGVMLVLIAMRMAIKLITG